MEQKSETPGYIYLVLTILLGGWAMVTYAFVYGELGAWLYILGLFITYLFSHAIAVRLSDAVERSQRLQNDTDSNRLLLEWLPVMKELIEEGRKVDKDSIH